MKTRVRQIDKNKWIVEEFWGSEWKICTLPFNTQGQAESYALYQSKSENVHAQYDNGVKIK